MSKTLYLKCTPDDIGEMALLTGDPARVERIGALLENARVVAQNREFYTITGTFGGRRFSAVSSGIGAPSAAIAVEELASLGVRAVVRVGTMMGIDVPLGSLMIPVGAVRYEGTSTQYADINFPAVPDLSLTVHLINAAKTSGVLVHTGISATYDAFYPQMAPSLMQRGVLPLGSLRRMNVRALDMETSLLFVLGSVLRIATGAVCLVTNLADPFSIIDTQSRDEGEQHVIRAALDALCKWRDQ